MRPPRTARPSPAVLRAGARWHQAQALVDRLQAAEVELRLAAVADGLQLPAAGRVVSAAAAVQRLRLEVEIERDRIAAAHTLTPIEVLQSIARKGS